MRKQWDGVGAIARRALLMLPLLWVALPVHAQDVNDACPLAVEMALEAVGEACGDLGQNEACYGHMLVEATFWEAQDDLVFHVPSDRVWLSDLRSLTGSALDLESQRWGVAVLRLQADLPEMLPGQAATFLLMGDMTLENTVTPEEVAGATPATEETGDADKRYGPMQAFYFNAGFGEPTCAEAPNALVVQSPEQVRVAFSINGMEVTLGSTAIFTMAQLPAAVVEETGTNPVQVMVATLVEGNMIAQFGETIIELDESGETLVVTLNEKGYLDAEAQPVVVGGMAEVEQEISAAVEEKAQNACQNASLSGVLERPLAEAECNLITAGGVGLENGTGGGPSEAAGASLAGVSENSPTLWTEGCVWEQLPDGTWVQVGAAEGCSAAPSEAIEPPPTPSTGVAPGPVGGESNTGINDDGAGNTGGSITPTIPAIPSLPPASGRNP